MRLTIKSVLNAVNELRQQKGGAPLKDLPKGYKNSHWKCPIANSLNDLFQIVTVTKNMNDTVCITTYDDPHNSISCNETTLPKECPISQFVLRFDKGGFRKYNMCQN